jgi:hypothetical protein
VTLCQIFSQDDKSALENFSVRFQPKTPENSKDGAAAEFLSITKPQTLIRTNQ